MEDARPCTLLGLLPPSGAPRPSLGDEAGRRERIQGIERVVLLLLRHRKPGPEPLVKVGMTKETCINTFTTRKKVMSAVAVISKRFSKQGA